MVVAVVSPDLASICIRPESGSLFCEFDFECRDNFGGGFLDTWFSEASMRFYDEQPNTALEPTADSAVSLAGSAGFATRQFGGGSAFGR